MMRMAVILRGRRMLAKGGKVAYTPPVAPVAMESTRNAVLSPSVAGGDLPAKEYAT